MSFSVQSYGAARLAAYGIPGDFSTPGMTPFDAAEGIEGSMPTPISAAFFLEHWKPGSQGASPLSGLLVETLAPPPVTAAVSVALPGIDPIFQEELLKRLSKEDQATLSIQMHNLPLLGEDEIRSLQTRVWTDPVFRRADFLVCAFKAYSEHRITQDALLHIFLYDSCKGCEGFRVHSGRDARIKVAAHTRPLFGYDVNTSKAAIESRKEFQEISKEDFQVFSFVVREDCRELHYRSIFRHASDYLDRTENGYPYPLICKKSWKTEVIMVPPKIFQVLLNCRFGAQAIQCKPVIGYRDVETLSDPRSRVVSLAGRIFAKRSYVHDYEVTAYPPALLFHDYTHCLMESANPHREVFTSLLKLPISKDLKLLFLDRDFIDYLTIALEIPDSMSPDAPSHFIALMELIDTQENKDLVYAFLSQKKEELLAKYGIVWPPPAAASK